MPDEIQQFTKEIYDLVEENFYDTHFEVIDLVDYDFLIEPPESPNRERATLGVCVDDVPDGHREEARIIVGEVPSAAQRNPSDWIDLVEIRVLDVHTVNDLAGMIAGFAQSHA